MFGLFKRKSDEKPPLQQSILYGYLGKTLLRPDFLKLNVASREAVAFDQWVQEGFAATSRIYQSKPKTIEQAATSFYFIAGNEEESSLLGVIQPSEDSSGRNYPFASFVHCGQPSFNKHPSGVFLGANSALNDLADITAKIHRAPNVQSMGEIASELTSVAHQLKRSVNLSQHLDDMRQIPMSEFWDKLGINNVEQRARLVKESSIFMQSMANRGCLRSQFGLRFPMPNAREDIGLIGGFWLHMAAMVIADHNWRPWVFVHQAQQDTSCSLTLFVRPMPASYFESIWLVNSQNQNVVDLLNNDNVEAVAPKYLALADMDNLSMYDALRRWCKV